MNKVFLLCSLFALFSCSNSDDESSSRSDFNPPAWIHGNWIQESTIGLPGVLFSFTPNDFCMTNSGISKQCQQEFVNQSRIASNAVSVTEVITASNYSAEIKYFAGQSIIYSFRKLTNNKIEWTAVPGSVFIKQ